MDSPTKEMYQEGKPAAKESQISSSSEPYIDPVAEKRLLRKLDMYLAPIMTLIFLMAYLDRSNIGNAASAGMLTDLHMTSSQYGSMYSCIAAD